jgi:hypothetical protein
MTKLNIAALAAIASAPPPPEPKVEGAVSTDTTVTFDYVPGAYSYYVYWRPTDANQWTNSVPVARLASDCDNGAPPECQAGGKEPFKVPLPHIRVDDWVFGVSSVSRDGFESPVASAVPGGAFHPYIAPEKK